ncbi:hypothetical protein D3C73_1031270 [compost metagenome]
MNVYESFVVIDSKLIIALFNNHFRSYSSDSSILTRCVLLIPGWLWQWWEQLGQRYTYNRLLIEHSANKVIVPLHYPIITV